MFPGIQERFKIAMYIACMLPAVTFKSILDNDFYKFTMQHAVVKLFPRAKARYNFINRGQHSFPAGFGDVLKASINEMEKLALSKAEKAFFSKASPYIDPVYFDFLEGYRYDPSEVAIEQTGSELKVVIEGLWYRTILWEVPILSLISELFYVTTGQERVEDAMVFESARKKSETLKDLGVTVADFGTRRRHSFQVQKIVTDAFTKHGGKSFAGSSNVYLAMLNGIKPIGTHAHEWFMFHAANYGYKMANELGLENWVEVYRGDLGIALSDTYTTDIFLKQFDKKFSKLFDGVRHDSGDPVVFANKVIHHYLSQGINPKSKTIIFSDALNSEKVARIAEYCYDKINVSFGIGTNLTNDVGLKPMNIVIKMTETCPKNEEWIQVVKLSDEEGKHTGTEEMINLAKEVLKLSNS